MNQPLSQDPNTKRILDSLTTKSLIKQNIYERTLGVFSSFKEQLESLADELAPAVAAAHPDLEVKYHSRSNFEADLKFAGDTLVFLMHTNVFSFVAESPIHRTDYVREDPTRSYTGMILIYNFLSDSIKYNRMHDVGYLVARVFINKDGHFFVQGRRQFSFLYNDLSSFPINDEVVKQISQLSIINTIDFDLFVPPFDAIKEVSIMQKVMEQGNAAIKTAKRLGFSIQSDVPSHHGPADQAS